MIRYDCDTMRDLIPPLVRGDLSPQEKAPAEAHLAACAPCSEEVAVVRLLQDAAIPVPGGFEARVLLAVRARRSAFWAPGRLAMAATVAAAVLGGSLMFERMYLNPAESMAGALDAGAASAVSWAATEDPLLHGASTLQDMSVEELEILLAELDS